MKMYVETSLKDMSDFLLGQIIVSKNWKNIPSIFFVCVLVTI